MRATEERDMSYVHHSILEKARKYPDQPVIQLPPDKNRYALPIILIGFKRVAYPSMGLRLANYEDPDVKGFKWEMKFRGSDRIFDSEITRLPDNGLELL